MFKKIFPLLLVLVFLAVGCQDRVVSLIKKDTAKIIPIEEKTEPAVQGDFTGSMVKGNYVYGAAMNLAWNDMVSNIIHGPVKLDTKDSAALRTTAAFNKAIFTKKDLDSASYYVKSGFGQKIVDQVNRESRAKFPQKSFSDLKINLRNTDFLAYAYFLKQVEYPKEFAVDKLDFNVRSKKQKVKSFYAQTNVQKGNVQILKYWNDEKFIISLRLKDANDRMLVAKGFDMTDPQTVVKEVNAINPADITSMEREDVFEMPMLHLDAHREYTEMIGEKFANLGFEKYIIGLMFENIKFDIDQKGARVENEAVIAGLATAMQPMFPPKDMVLNKPFWIVMERKDSKHPYFILGVNNAELMEKE
ncbi:MAG: hypothetical protein WCW31_03135 [Patescibacteria group bacterium]